MFRSPAALMGAALIGMGLIGCSEPPPPEPVELIRPVKSFLIASSSSTTTRAFPARIDAGRRAELAFRVSGVLKELPVKEGDRVKEGQLVALLDPTDLQITYSNRKAGFDNAKRNFTRAQELVREGNISKMDYDRLEAEYKSAEAA